MAARKSERLSDKHRAAIQTSMLVNRLTNHALVTPDDEDFQKKVMAPSQVTAAVALLRKTLPDLTATEFKGEVQKTYVVRAPEKAEDWNTWRDQFQPEQQQIPN